MNSHLSRLPAIRKTPLFVKVGFRGESTTTVHGQMRTIMQLLETVLT